MHVHHRALAVAAIVFVAAAAALLAAAGPAAALPPRGTCVPLVTCRGLPHVPPPTAPSGLTVTGSTTSSISLAWTSHRGDTENDVQRRPPAGVWVVVARLPASGASMSYADSGLAASTPYCYRVVAVGFTRLETAGSEVCAVATSTPPAAASGLSPQATSQSAIRLAWQDNASNEQGSAVDRRQAGASAWSTIASYGFSGTGARSLVDSGLAVGTSYCYRVRTWNRFGEADSAQACGRTQAPPPPAAPSDVSLVAYQQTVNAGYHVSVSFRDNATDETGFTIRAQGASGAWSTAATAPPLAGTGYDTVDGGPVGPSTHYCFVVSAVDAWGSSDSPVTCYTTPELPPAAPSDLAATGATQSSLSVSWQDNSTDEQLFLLFYGVQGSTTGHIERLDGHPGTGTATATLGGLQPATTYCLQVVAAKDASSTSDGIESFGTKQVCAATAAPAAPAAPTGVAVTKTTTGSISLGWTDASTDETGFRVDRQSGSGWTTAGSVGAGVTSFTDTGLDSGTQYCYRVVAVNAGGSAASATVCGKTATPEPNLAISGIYLTQVGDRWTSADVLSAGDPFSISWDECDVGPGVAAAHQDRLDVWNGVGQISTDTVQAGPLAPGACERLSVDATHGLPGGEYDAIVTLDSGSAVAETVEGDNAGRMTFSILSE